jgi:single-strand DNA-binding protein
MNKIILLGNLTKDPDLTTTTSGLSVAKFTVAVPRKFKNAQGEKEVDFLNVVVWRTLADNCCKYLKKGSKCSVVGTVQNRSYEAQDGTKRYITEILAEEVEFLSTKKEETSTNESKTELTPIDDVLIDLPF